MFKNLYPEKPSVLTRELRTTLGIIFDLGVADDLSGIVHVCNMNKTALSSYSVPLASHIGKILQAAREFRKVWLHAKKWGMLPYLPNELFFFVQWMVIKGIGSFHFKNHNGMEILRALTSLFYIFEIEFFLVNARSS